MLHRELERLRQYLADLGRAETAVDRIVGGVRHHAPGHPPQPAAARLLSGELDTLVSTMAGRTDQVLAMVRMFIASQLRAEQAAGEIAPDVDVEVAADVMTRVAISYMLIPSDVIDLDDDAAALAMARAFVMPMLGGGEAQVRYQRNEVCCATAGRRAHGDQGSPPHGSYPLSGHRGSFFRLLVRLRCGYRDRQGNARG